jgi:hypothetical protein
VYNNPVLLQFSVRTRELEASVLAREEFQRQAWWGVLRLMLMWLCTLSHLSFACQLRHCRFSQVRSIVSETVVAAACIGQAQQELLEAKRAAQVLLYIFAIHAESSNV